MQYLTSEHLAPAPYIESGGVMVSTAPLMAAEDSVALAPLDIWEHIMEEGAAPLGYADWARIAGTPDYYLKSLNGTPEEREAATAAQTRAQLTNEINTQVIQPTAAQVAVDPGLEGTVVRYDAAANDRLVALEGTADADLDAFDTTIQVAETDAPMDYSRLTLTIGEVEPRVGFTENIGWIVRLEVQSGLEDQGAEARIQVVAAPAPGDIGAIIPGTQDPDEPNIWHFEVRVGYAWDDKNLPAAVQLLWGAGSLITSRVLRVTGFDDRDSTSVRYAVANGRRRR